jgi:hypothetical protein
VLLPPEGTTAFCLADRRSATSASSSCTRALASSRYFSCAKISLASCNPCKEKTSAKHVKGVREILLTRYTAEPKRATGIMPGSRSEYHCAWADLPEAADWLYVRHRGLGLTDIVRCHVARSMIGRRDRPGGARCLNNSLLRDSWSDFTDERTRVG